MQIECTLARIGAERLWEMLHADDFVAALGALTGNQAIQQVRCGLKAIYVSGWQVAADANESGEMYPDQSLYPVTAFHLSSGGSITPFSVPIKFITRRVKTTLTGLFR